MFSLIKNIFNKKDDNLFSLHDNPSFESLINFTAVDEAVLLRLHDHLVTLTNYNQKLIIEKPLKNQSFTVHKNIYEILEVIKQDLEFDISDITRVFEHEPLAFKYFLGREVMFAKSVEIVKEIYHKERDDLGKIYSALVVKHYEGQYYYWRW